MADPVGGAALGAAFELLFKAVIDATQRVYYFNSDLERLKSTLFTIKPIFDDIEKFNEILDRRQFETEMFSNRLKEAVNLVDKCSKVKRNLCKRFYYSRRLSKLEKALLSFFQIEVAALNFRESKKVSVGVDNVQEKVNEIAMLLKKNCGINGVISKAFPGWCSVPGPPDFVVGLDRPLEQVKEMLLRDDINVLMISAPGGCGKTTLATKVFHDRQIRGIYGSNIFFAAVSRMPNLHAIVQKVFRTISNKEAPDFQGDEEPIHQLEQLLLRHTGNDPVLLVLDDVWSGAESLIEKFMFKRPGYKILVTSRSEFPRFNTYKLNLLTYEESLELFNHFAFEDGIRMIKDDLVKKVVERCGGFPLALKVIGRSLYRKPGVIWISRINEWSNGQSILNTNSELLRCLKPSLDNLDELPILKDCYLDLGSFPEDHKIPATDLNDIWTELYNLHQDVVYTLAYLYELSTRNLVDIVLDRNNAFDADCIDEQFVVQHDLLRELAIYQSSLEPLEIRRRLLFDIMENKLPTWWVGQKQQTLHARLLSISTDQFFSSNWFDVELPDVEVLILNFQTKIYNLPQFIETMRHLKVLIITNNGICPARLNNFPLPNHLLNLKRIKLEHVSMLSIGTSILQLRNLRKISLVMCEIGDMFEKSAVSTPYIWPNLVEINIDYCDDLTELPAWLCGCFHLRKMSINYCQELFALPDELGNLTNLEVLKLASCTTLSKLPDSITRLHKLRFLDLSDCVEIEHLPEQIGELSSLSKLDMRGCGGLSDLPPSVLNLGRLKHVICDEETAYLWEFYKDYWSDLNIDTVKEDKHLNWLHKHLF